MGTLLTLGIMSSPALGLPAGNNALDFDGVNDYVEVADPVDVIGPLTIEAWILVRDATTGGRIVTNTWNNTGYDLNIYDGGSGQIAASEVHAGARDGRLGVNLGDDTQDPSWVISGITSSLQRSLGWLKSMYR